MNFIEEKIIKKGNLDKLKLRFPPEPNFPGLSLGHAKSIYLNFGLAEKYNRPCVLRFDDTNPLAESAFNVKRMIDDIHWLGYTPSEVKFTSDYFPFIYGCAIKLIKKGLAYVDFSTSEEIATLKGTPTKSGTNSPYRDTSIEDNLKLFEEMKDGKNSCTLRLKIDMSHANMLMRDPIIYRIINCEHHHTGNTWKIYPMYDFAHPISDYIESITDSLCTLEFEVHKPLYIWILENLELTPIPEETEFARLNITHNVMSKRKFKKLMEEGIINSFDDPRLPTISGLRRRGYTPTAIKNFCEKVGVTRRESVIPMEMLEECLRDDLNENADRYMAVFDPIKLTITNYEGTENFEIEANPKTHTVRNVSFSNSLYIESDDFREVANNKYHRLKLGFEVRLKGAYIIKANEVIKDKDGNIIEVLCTYDPETKSGTATRSVKGTIHWVNRNDCMNFEVREFDKLFTVESPDSEEDFLTCVNKNSIKVSKGYCESNCKYLEIGKSVQMMRKGYYVLDTDTVTGLIFNKVVDLKSSFNI